MLLRHMFITNTLSSEVSEELTICICNCNQPSCIQVTISDSFMNHFNNILLYKPYFAVVSCLQSSFGGSFEWWELPATLYDVTHQDTVIISDLRESLKSHIILFKATRLQTGR
jgi:hypothetical protein